jgi:MFS family permease
MPFGSLPQTAYVSVPTEQTFEAQTLSFNPPPLSIPQDNEIGRKTFLWYRVYCGFLMVMYLLVTLLGVFLAAFAPDTREYKSEETFIMGIIYAVLGVVFFIVFAVALFLPRKPYNWIVGIVMMALGMTSCCFLPFLIPLIIYWVKPETKAYFGRN